MKRKKKTYKAQNVKKVSAKWQTLGSMMKPHSSQYDEKKKTDAPESQQGVTA